jgi:von Willebrand factor type A C-terminal domain/von Willebrand factor type A domain
MSGENIAAAQRAARAALDQVLDGVWFAVVAGNHDARLAFPEGPVPAMARMDDRTRAEAKAAVTGFRADGGTAMGTWLTLATRLFDAVPSAGQRHAILLTDGVNQHETPEQLDAALEAARGRFQCDCRGVGSAWRVAEVRRIATALLGSVDLIAKPDQMAADFGRIVRQSMSRGVADASLQVWVPQDAQVLFVRQVSPTVQDLTALRRAVNPLTGSYPTGAWGDESRDYHLAVRLTAKEVGQEQLAARVQVAVDDVVVAQGLVRALWSDDDSLTARIDPAVAHYTGQEQLAEAIQAGLAAKAAGDTRGAAVELGRAVRLAEETGNEEVTSRLRKVVEVDDPGTGSVRLRGGIDKLDEMALDTASTKTTRVRK